MRSKADDRLTHRSAVAYLAVAGTVARWWIAEHETSPRQEFTVNGVLASHVHQELMGE